MFARRRTLRVLIVDDDPHFAELLAVLLAEDPRLTVVGRADDGADGVALAVRLRPDVVVMDVEMPVLDGVAAAHRIRRRLRGTRVVLVSGSDDPGVAARAWAADADAFVCKTDLQKLRESVAGRRSVAFAFTPSVAAA